jgi:hypothetical protein
MISYMEMGKRYSIAAKRSKVAICDGQAITCDAKAATGDVFRKDTAGEYMQEA